MCGILFIEKYKKDIDLKNFIKTSYLNQKERGTEGFGYLAIYNDNTVSLKRATDEKTIFEKMKTESESDLKAILFHHRYPTSTDNYVEATHPIKVTRKDKTYYVIHNGVISNDDTLFEKHSIKGIRYTTQITTKIVTNKSIYMQDSVFNDSESLAYDFVLYLEGYIKKVRAKGSMAVMVIEVDNTTQKATNLYYFRNNGNPIQKQIKNKFFKLSSVNKKGSPIEINTLFIKDLATGITTEQEIPLEGYSVSTYKYPTYPTNYVGYNTGLYDTDDDDDYYDSLYNINSYKKATKDEIEEFYLDFDDTDLQEQIISLQADLDFLESKKNYSELSKKEILQEQELTDEINYAKKELQARAIY